MYIKKNMLNLADSTFRIKRPVISRVSGLLAEIDPHVKNQIIILSGLLNKKCISEDDGDELKTFLAYSIDVLAKTLGDTDAALTFSEYIQKNNAGLYLEVSDLIDIKKQKLGYNTNRLLSEEPIFAYLFCKAAYDLGLDKSDDAATAICNYITKDTSGGGIKLFYDYIALNAALEIIKAEKIDVGNNNFQDNLELKIKGTNIKFSEDIFTSNVISIINNLLYSKEENKIISSLRTKLNIEDEEVPALVRYMQQSRFNFDQINSEYYLAIALDNIRSTGISYITGPSTEIEDIDFSVNFYEDEKGTLEFARENIACAAQMYYVMTLGDELEIFNVMNRIVTHYLPSGLVDIRSKDVLKDLQSYVFNDSFKDQNRIEYRRTHPEERKMFYKQLFNVGGGEIVEGMVINEDFNMLWKKLFVETARYIEKVEQSAYPMDYVSNQNICQTVEDLQYNLSTHCTGMIKVVSPIINKELDFVVEKFLKNEELVKQLALNNSRSLWKVVERVLTDLRHEVPNVSAIRNKGVLGYKIISTIANYTQGYFDDDENFAEFISTVEAFIIANEQIEERRSQAMPGLEDNYPRSPPSSDEGNEVVQENEWNF